MALQTRSSSPAPPYPWASGSVAAPGASQKKRKHDPSSPATSPGSGVAAAPAAPNPPQKKRKHDLSFLVASPGSGVAAAPAAPNPLQKKNKREVSLPSAALRNPALAPGLIERDFCFSCLWRLGQDFAHKCEFRSTGASCDSCNSKRRGCKAIPTSFFSLTNYCIAQARFAADGSLSPTPRFIKSELLSLHRLISTFYRKARVPAIPTVLPVEERVFQKLGKIASHVASLHDLARFNFGLPADDDSAASSVCG